MPGKGVGHGPELHHQSQRAHADFACGIVESLPLRTVFVRFQKQLVNTTGNILRQFSGNHLRSQVFTTFLFLTLAFDSLQCALQNVFWRLFVVAAPFAVEVDRIGVQRHQSGTLLHRRHGRKIFSGYRLVTELLVRRHFPHEHGIDIGRSLLRLRQKGRGCR